MWGDDDTPWPSPSAHPPTVAGNPILLDFNAARYQAFFYCNATSFVASIAVILLLLQRTLKKQQPGAPLRTLQTAVVLDLLGLLGAYAAGSCRDWETSGYVIALVAVVVVFIALHGLLSFDIVFNKARKLLPKKYFGGGNDVEAQPGNPDQTSRHGQCLVYVFFACLRSFDSKCVRHTFHLMCLVCGVMNKYL
uniref:PGG domain-containing protein n=1 Tax=Triticum urartu TaxID=4572 RepID=A0A8R7QIB2_TRIUA